MREGSRGEETKVWETKEREAGGRTKGGERKD